MRRANKFKFLLLMYLLLGIVSCADDVESKYQEKVKHFIINNPLLFYIDSGIMIGYDPPENYTVTYFPYSDIEKGKINLGDNEYLMGRRYETKDGVIYKSVSTYIIGGKSIDNYTWYELLSFDNTEMVISVRDLKRLDPVIKEYDIHPNDNTLIISRERGSLYDVIEISDVVKVWQSKKLYEEQQHPTNIVSFSSNEILYKHFRPSGILLRTHIYKEGILVEAIEHKSGTHYKYTVVDGEGEYLVERNGEIISRDKLIRKRNEKGLLVYQKVVFSDGSGSEFILDIIE